MKAFWGTGKNVGDTLTPVILEHFTGHKAEWVSSLEDNKLLLCGSILEFAKPGDTVLGAGHYKEENINLDGVRVLALRGENSGNAPVYGDPAILLPLVYNPEVKIKHKIGYIPHLWERELHKEGHMIDVELDWKKFVREILSCESVVSSSLHGVIIAEAYGVPVHWRESAIVPGARIKYEDYQTGVKNGFEEAQYGLMEALQRL